MRIPELFKITGLLKLTAILSLIAIIAITITISVLYKLALEQHGLLLSENVSSQVALMHTMQQLAQDKNTDGDLILKVISNMQEMNQQAAAVHQSDEFTVAKREDDRIVFLLFDKGYEHDNFSIAANSKIAEPTRLALAGGSGRIIGRDYHGVEVLAAYQFMPEYGLGIVSKIDIAEVFRPYLWAILISSFIAIIFVLMGVYAFFATVRPFYVEREEMAKRLRKQHSIMSRVVEKSEVNPCDMQSIFEEITEAACEGLNVSRVSVWLFDTDCREMHCADQYDSVTSNHDMCESLFTDDFPSYIETLIKNRVIDASDVYKDKRTRELLDSYLIPKGVKSLLDVPIQLDGELIGVVCHEQLGIERFWNLEDKNFAHSVAHHIAISISTCRRNKAEQYLKESEQRYELAVTGSSDGLWDWDIVSNKVYRSPQYKKLLGYENEEFKDDHATWLELLHPDDRQRTEVAINAHLANADVPYDVEYRIRTKSGAYRWFRGRANALRDDNGKPYRIAGSVTDITDFKKIQYSLTRFKLTLDEISENIYMFDPETWLFFYVNKSAIDDSGYTEEELMQMTPLDIRPEFNEKSLRELLSTLIAKPGDTLNFETVHRRKNGEEVTVEVHLQYIEPINAPPRFVSAVRDISERRATEIENYIQRTMLEHIYKAEDNFISGEDRQKVFEQLLNGILDITESEFGVIGDIVHLHNQQAYLRIRYITNISWNEEMQNFYDERMSGGFELGKQENLLSAVITAGEAVISNDPANDQKFGGLPEGHPPLESFMGIPLKLGKNMTGMIGIANRTAGYSADIIKQLQPLLSTCANLLEAEKTEVLRNSMENALRNSEEKANTVLATVADGIITIDDRGYVESFNHAAEEIFGYKKEEVLARNINMLMPAPYKEAHDGYIKNYQQTGEARVIGQDREVEGQRKDGSVFPMELAVSEIHLGSERKYTGVVRDISERKQAEIALISARDEAEQANRTKSEFLSSMSHELRTPLNAIMGFAQILQYDTALSGIQKGYVKTIHDAGSLLLELIEDVLNLAKIEAGRTDLLIDSIKLQDVLQDSFMLIRPLAEKHGVTLSFGRDISENGGCSDHWVRADNTRLKQVLLNLLSNAIKYNKKNGTVSISCYASDDGFHHICIADSGRGISPEDMDNLFQPFNRLGAQHGEIEGTGIGLVITRTLVELMGGKISVESELGKGSSFIIKLPATQAVATASRFYRQREKPVNLNAMNSRILVAEDNLVNQELMTLQLETLGYQADIVRNGVEAMDRLLKHDYDLLLTDIHMPEMDGYQLTQAIRRSSSQNFKDIVIIAITANAATDEAARCIDEGMNDYLSKPININELQRKIQRWQPGAEEPMVKKEAEDTQTNSEEKATIAVEEAGASVIDEAILNQYIGSDPAKQRRFLKLFLETTPETIQAIHQAYTDCSVADMENAGHKLKSSAHTIGAIVLSTLCQQIETAAVDNDWKLIGQAVSEVDATMDALKKYIQEFLLKEV